MRFLVIFVDTWAYNYRFVFVVAKITSSELHLHTVLRAGSGPKKRHVYGVSDMLFQSIRKHIIFRGKQMSEMLQGASPRLDKSQTSNSN